MRRLTTILLIASAAMFFIPGAASASWTCTAHSRFGNHGWGRDSDRASAASRAMYECSIRGGGCRLTSCVSNNRRRGHPCPSGWCDWFTDGYCRGVAARGAAIRRGVP